MHVIPARVENSACVYKDQHLQDERHDAEGEVQQNVDAGQREDAKVDGAGNESIAVEKLIRGSPMAVEGPDDFC